MLMKKSCAFLGLIEMGNYEKSCAFLGLIEMGKYEKKIKYRWKSVLKYVYFFIQKINSLFDFILKILL